LIHFYKRKSWSLGGFYVSDDSNDKFP